MPVHIPPHEPDTPVGSPVIISESGDYIVVAIEIPKASLRRHARFIEQVAAIAQRDGG
jgi:hypothetical protein